MVEIGYNQGEQVKQLFEKNGFTDIAVNKIIVGIYTQSLNQIWALKRPATSRCSS